MVEELKAVQSEIKHLEDQLKKLRKKEDELKRVDNVPDLIGKYIYLYDGVYETYMRIDGIKPVELMTDGFIANGPSVNIVTQLIGVNYNLKSHDWLSLNTNNYSVIDFQEYKKAIDKAMDSF